MCFSFHVFLSDYGLWLGIVNDSRMGVFTTATIMESVILWLVRVRMILSLLGAWAGLDNKKERHWILELEEEREGAGRSEEEQEGAKTPCSCSDPYSSILQALALCRRSSTDVPEDEGPERSSPQPLVGYLPALFNPTEGSEGHMQEGAYKATGHCLRSLPEAA